MGILRYTHLFYFVSTWILVFILMKPKRVKELFPIAILGIVALTLTDIFITSLGLYKFIKPLVNVWGAPLFHLLWAGAAALILIHFMKPGFNRKIVILLFFTGVTLILEYIAESAGVAERLGKYTHIHAAMLDFAVLVVLLWVCEGLYGNRIYKKEK